jgi:uncharacterized protein
VNEDDAGVTSAQSGENGGPDKDARTWAMLCHLTAFAGYCVPLGNVLVPLIIWAIKRDDSPFVDDQGKEALNFQLSVTIAMVLTVPLFLILVGFLMLAALLLFQFVMVILASVKSYDGEEFRYPITIRFFR